MAGQACPNDNQPKACGTPIIDCKWIWQPWTQWSWPNGANKPGIRKRTERGPFFWGTMTANARLLVPIKQAPQMFAVGMALRNSKQKNRPRLTKIMSKGNMCSTVPCNARTEVSKGKPKCDKADCTFMWGKWADPQQCGTTGTVKRMRKITQEAQCGGKRCSAPAYETREAKSPYDPKQDCVESWTPWSKCTGGRKRVRLGIEWLEMVPSKLC